MKPLRVFLLAWSLAGLGAVAGSILGNAAGRPGLFAGAVAGGVLGVTAAVMLAVRVSWLPGEARIGAWLGGVIGFALAAPIAVTHLDTPITPVFACGLVGAGVLIGAGAGQPPTARR